MEKEFGQIKITETESGFRIDMSGKSLKEMLCCCVPMFAACCESKSECCPGEEEKK